jgi:hypothetical protein
MMARKIRWRRKPCPHCRDLITTNALGRAAHIRFCTGERKPEPPPRHSPPGPRKLEAA